MYTWVFVILAIIVVINIIYNTYSSSVFQFIVACKQLRCYIRLVMKKERCIFAQGQRIMNILYGGGVRTYFSVQPKPKPS